MRLLKAFEVADMLGHTTRWVLGRAATGELPSYKIGRSVRFSEDDVMAWLDARKRGVQSPERHLRTIGGSR